LVRDPAVLPTGRGHLHHLSLDEFLLHAVIGQAEELFGGQELPFRGHEPTPRYVNAAASAYTVHGSPYPRPVEGAAGEVAGEGAVADGGDAVDEHVAHTHGVLVRVRVRGAVGDGDGIEDNDIGEVAGFQPAAMVEA